MKALTIASLVAWLAANPVSAWNYIDRSQYCVAGCEIALEKVTFHLPHKGTKKTDEDLCSGIFLESLFTCSAVYCSEKEIVKGFEEQSKTCIANAGIALPDAAIATQNLTTEYLASVLRVSKKAATKENYTSPVIPDETFYGIGLQTVADQNNASRFDWTFGWSLYGFWTVVLLAGMLHRAMIIAKTPSMHSLSAHPRAENTGTHNGGSLLARASTWSRRHLLLPYFFGDGTQPASLGGTIPTRVEGLIIVIYVIVNLVFCVPGYHTFTPNLKRPLPVVQLTRYIGNRCGVLAIANLPVIWVFGARNNPFLWLTGWPFATFSQFHRWAGRLAALEAVAHGIFYSVAYAYQGQYYDNWAKMWFYCGVIAVAAMAFLFAQSNHLIRRFYYDAFLVIHFSLALILLITIYFHLEKMDDDSFFAFIWTCVAMWSVDRSLRLGRLLYHSFLPNSKGVKAVASYEPETDIIRLDFTSFFSKKALSAPGAFYYVYEPGRIRGYESHPFTLCSWPQHSSAGSVPDSPVVPSDKEKESSVAAVPESPQSMNDTTGQYSHSFLIRPRSGFTKDLRHKISMQEEVKAYPFTVLLEGPYGENFPLEQHSDVLMIIGGSGITAAVSRVYALLASSKSRINIVWAAQHKAFVDNVCEHELKGLVGHERVKLDVYLTKNSSLSEKLSGSTFEMHEGRPDIEAILNEAAMQCSTSLGVFCCGPQQMGALCRGTIAKLLGERGRDVCFYEERFGW